MNRRMPTGTSGGVGAGGGNAPGYPIPNSGPSRLPAFLRIPSRSLGAEQRQDVTRIAGDGFGVLRELAGAERAEGDAFAGAANFEVKVHDAGAAGVTDVADDGARWRGGATR